MTRVGVVLQARMGSSRLPGKSLADLGGRPLIERVMARLERASRVDVRVLAVPEGPGDDALAAAGESRGWEVLRGSEHDVLDRTWQAALRFELDHVVRATGDNPLVDGEELERLIACHLAGGFDHSSNRTSDGSGLPVGVGCEVFTCAALCESWHEAVEPRHREHIDEYLLDNRERHQLGTLSCPDAKLAPHLSFTVDRPEQLAWCQAVHAALPQDPELGQPRTEAVIAAVRDGSLREPPPFELAALGGVDLA